MHSIIMNFYIGNSKKFIKNEKGYKIIWYIEDNLSKREIQFNYNELNKDSLYISAKSYYSKIKNFKYISISLKKYLSLQDELKKELIEYSKFKHYANKKINLDPYIAGSLYSTCFISEYYTPSDVNKYLKNSEEIRLQFLAGIIDNIGYVINNKQCVLIDDCKHTEDFILLLNGLCIMYKYKNNIFTFDDNIPYCKINVINKKLYNHREILTKNRY